GIAAELSPARPGAVVGPASAVGPVAWALLGLLALALAASSGGRLRAGTLLGLVGLGLTVPVLIAGPVAAGRATASGLRWGPGVCFLLYSIPLWLRGPLGRLLRRRGGRIEPDLDLSAATRWLLIAGAAVPVVLLTLVPVAVGYSGQRVAGPAAGSLFVSVGPPVPAT